MVTVVMSVHGCACNMNVATNNTSVSVYISIIIIAMPFKGFTTANTL